MTSPTDIIRPKCITNAWIYIPNKGDTKNKTVQVCNIICETVL